MGARILSFFRPAPAAYGDWSQQELAEFYRVESALVQAGILAATDRGLSDEGEPWFVFCRPETNDVIVHFARIAGSYVIASDAYDTVLRGPDFRALINDMAARYPMVLPVQRAVGGGKVLLHPAALVTALVATAFFKIGAGEALADDLDLPDAPATATGPVGWPATTLPRATNDAADGFADRHAAMVMSAIAIAAAMAIIPIDWRAEETIDVSSLLGLDGDQASTGGPGEGPLQLAALEVSSAAANARRDWAEPATGAQFAEAVVNGSGAVEVNERRDRAETAEPSAEQAFAPIAAASLFEGQEVRSDARAAAAAQFAEENAVASERVVFDALILLGGGKRPLASTGTPPETPRAGARTSGFGEVASDEPMTLALRLVTDEVAESRAQVSVTRVRSTDRLEEALRLALADLDELVSLRDAREPSSLSTTLQVIEPVRLRAEPESPAEPPLPTAASPPAIGSSGLDSGPLVAPPAVPGAAPRPSARLSETTPLQYDARAHDAIETFMQVTDGYSIMVSGENIMIYDADTSQTWRADYGVRSWIMDDGSTISIIGILPSQLLHAA